MAQHPLDRQYRVEDLYGLPDDGLRYELQAGWLVSEPSPGWRHGRVAATIARILGEHVRSNRQGVVATNDAGFILARSPDTVRAPDVACVTRERADRVGDTSQVFPSAPDLAVEVLSPSDRADAVRAKVGEYLAAGTQLVWIVDPERRRVTVYRDLLAPVVLDENDELTGAPLLPELRVPVRELFEI